MIYLLGIISIFIIIAHVQAFSPPTKPYRHGETLLHAGLNGAALLLENISISRGADQIISNLDLRVERNERWGIVGANGNPIFCFNSNLVMSRITSVIILFLFYLFEISTFLQVPGNLRCWEVSWVL